MGRTVFLAYLCCLSPHLSAEAQSHSTRSPDLNQLQQQVIELSGRLDRTSYLITGVLLHLDPGDRLTFHSDDVVEARNKAGELFGFERATQLSTEPAEKVAQAAQAFGQEDDITVLTVTFAPAGVLHA